MTHPAVSAPILPLLKRLSALGLLALTFTAPAVAQQKPSTPTQSIAEADSERSAHLLRLATDNRVSFVNYAIHMGSGVPRGANVVYPLSDQPPLLRASLAREVLSSGRANLLADLASGLATSATDLEPPPKDGLPLYRAFKLASDQVLVLRDVEQPWPRPELLLQLTHYAEPHGPTTWSLSDGSLADGQEATCFSVQAIQAASGKVALERIACKNGNFAIEDLRDTLKRMLRDTCQPGPLVSVLPLQEVRGDATTRGKPSESLDIRLIDQISALGCRVQDVPSLTPGVNGPLSASRDSGPGPAWRYHPRLLSLSRPATLATWADDLWGKGPVERTLSTEDHRLVGRMKACGETEESLTIQAGERLLSMLDRCL